MARLHDHADQWRIPPGFVRIRWDWETFFGDTMVYGGINAARASAAATHNDTICLLDGVKMLALAAMAVAGTVMARWSGRQPDKFRLSRRVAGTHGADGDPDDGRGLVSVAQRGLGRASGPRPAMTRKTALTSRERSGWVTTILLPPDGLRNGPAARMLDPGGSNGRERAGHDEVALS